MLSASSARWAPAVESLPLIRRSAGEALPHGSVRHADCMDTRDPDRGTFGQADELDWRELDRLPREYRLPDQEGPEHLHDVLPKDVAEEIADWTYAVPLAAGSLYQHLPGGAVQYILTGAVNDAVALVLHVDRFDGRSAAHAARALFEHMVNLCDVLEGPPEVSERYLDHRHVTADQVARHRWYLDGLDKETGRKERRRLDALARRTKRPLAEAIAKYGPGFRRSWAVGTLKDRADAHNLSDCYEGYRILSSVIHASSGAMAGIVKPIAGHPVHRIGLDMDLAATAYAEGLNSFYQIAERLKDVAPVTEAEEILGRTGNLLWYLQQVRAALRRVDQQTWPTDPGPATLTFAGIWPSGTVRWYLHDLRYNSVVLADLVDPEPDLSEYIDHATAYDPEAFGGRPVTAVHFDLRATARPGSPRVPAASILIPPGHPAERRYRHGR